MKKTISVHIGGRLFNIEEAAYTKLSTYLNTIRGYFNHQESAEEILSDIELRIAELFMERVTPQKEVITDRDVDDIISIMGQPEDYLDGDDDAGEEDTSHTYRQRSTTKQVFRDPDNKIVAGVCSGISAYLGMDPIILRALFVIITIFYGSGAIIYLVLAVIIPKAKTTAEKLQMRGEPVTVENISRKVSESFHIVKEDLKDFGKKNNIHKESFDKAKRNAEATTSTVVDGLGNLLKLILIILTKIIGTVLLIAGVLVIFVSLALGFGWENLMAINLHGALNDTNLPYILSSIFESVDQKTMFSIGLLLTLIVPGISFLLMGMRLLFDFKKTPVWSGVLLVIIWFAGVSLLGASGAGVYRNFQVSTSFTEKAPLIIPATDTLYIDLLPQIDTKYNFSNGYKSRKFYYDYDVTYPGIESTNILYIGDIKLYVEMNSADTLYKLNINRKAHGATRADAVKNADNLTSIAKIIGDSLLFHPYYAVLKNGKIRNQEISYTLQVPVGKAVHFNEKAKSIIYDVANVTDMYDWDMINHTWLMTQNGLVCTTCSVENHDRDETTY